MQFANKVSDPVALRKITATLSMCHLESGRDLSMQEDGQSHFEADIET